MAIDLNNLPSYDRLPVKEGAPKGSAWGLFGDEDQLGCLNLITPEKTAEAVDLNEEPLGPADTDGERVLLSARPNQILNVRFRTT